MRAVSSSVMATAVEATVRASSDPVAVALVAPVTVTVSVSSSRSSSAAVSVNAAVPVRLPPGIVTVKSATGVKSCGDAVPAATATVTSMSSWRGAASSTAVTVTSAEPPSGTAPGDAASSIAVDSASLAMSSANTAETRWLTSETLTDTISGEPPVALPCGGVPEKARAAGSKLSHVGSASPSVSAALYVTVSPSGSSDAANV